jgi:hypothetical protein
LTGERVVLKVTVDRRIYLFETVKQAADDFRTIIDLEIKLSGNDVSIECDDAREWLVDEFLNYVLIDLAIDYS